MRILWTVVVDDGTRPYGPGVQVDQRRPFAIRCGETTTIEISPVNPVGGAVALAPGDFFELTARSGGLPARQILHARSAASANGKHTMPIGADATMHLAPRRGSYDLWLIRGSDRQSAIPLSEFSLEASALGNNYL